MIFFYLIRFAVNAVAIALTAWLLPGITVINDNIGTYLWLALGMALINTVIRPIVLLFTGQWIIATMGLMIMVINGLMLWLTSSVSQSLGLGFHVSGFWAAFFGGLVISIVSTLVSMALGPPRVEVEVYRDR